MSNVIATRAIVTFIIGLSLAQQADSQSSYGVSASEAGGLLPDSEFASPASGIGASSSVTAPSSKAEGTQSGGARSTISQIERLVAFQQSPAVNPPGMRPAESVNGCVEHYLREVDPKNRAWNPSDPRWDTMRAVIARDCTAEIDGYKKKVAPVLRKAYSDAIRRSYENHLSSTEADTLIWFYESDTGQRYLAFQGQLLVASARGMGRLFSGPAGPASRASTSEVVKARMYLLRLSRTFSMLFVANEDARRSGSDATGAPAIVIMMRMTAESQGEALDRIGREYSADLHNFATFVESPAEIDELRALYEATGAASAAAGKIAVEVSPELNGNLNKWRDLYHSLPRDQ